MLLVHENRFEPSLQEMPHGLVATVMRLGVGAIEVVHTLGKVRGRRFDDEMIVIFHQAVRVAKPGVTINGRFQNFQKFPIVLFVVEDAIAGIAA